MVNQPKNLQTASNSPSQYSGGITIKSPREREAMRQAGAIVGAVLAILRASVTPGMTTKDLDSIAYREITRRGGVPTFMGYRGFPASICTGKRVLKEGDIVKMDVGATLNGHIGDAAISVPVGDVGEAALDLIETTRLSLEEGIKAARPGNRVGDIGAAVQAYGEARGYGVVREYVGHGVGRFLHEDPQIPNYGQAGRGPLLRPGMCIAIEPMLNMGDWRTTVMDDQWTVITSDSKLSCHFEHTIAIDEDGPVVLTVPDPEAEARLNAQPQN